MLQLDNRRNYHVKVVSPEEELTSITTGRDEDAAKRLFDAAKQDIDKFLKEHN